MKLTYLQAENFLGIRAASVALDRTVNLFAGGNGAGKSSLSEAIRMALSGEAVRVSLKKEYGQLVTDGAKHGFAEVGVDLGGVIGTATVLLPKGAITHTGYQPPPALGYVLDAQRFASMDANERRAFLFGLMGVRRDAGDIARRLEARGCMIGRIQRILPLLRGGFDSACKEAKSNATTAKGAWRAVTGETYGSEKGKTWRAELPTFDAAHMPKLATELKHCDAAMQVWHETIGRLQAQEQRRAQLQAKLPALREQAAGAERIKKKDAADRAELAKVEDQLTKARAAAGGGPRVGLVHELAKALRDTLFFVGDDHEFRGSWAAPLAAYEAEHGPLAATAGDPQARARLPALDQAHGMASRAIANNARDLEAVQRAAAEVESITTELAEEFDAAGLAQARTEAETLKKTRAEILTKIDLQKSIKAQVEGAEKKNADAALHHEDVAAWDAIGDALAPDGIPGELLTEALEPINERLRRSAMDAEWPVVCISADMSMHVGDQARPYALLSESEKWRADAMVAEAVSHLSGLKLLVLDRFDMLDGTGRSDLLAWLDVLASEGELETALIFGTLKALPAELPETMAAHWIEAGAVGAARALEAA